MSAVIIVLLLALKLVSKRLLLLRNKVSKLGRSSSKSILVTLSNRRYWKKNILTHLLWQERNWRNDPTLYDFAYLFVAVDAMKCYNNISFQYFSTTATKTIKTQYSSRTQFYTFSTYVTVSVFKYGMTVTVALLDFVLLSKIRKRFAAHELSRRTAVLWTLIYPEQ